MKTPLLLQPQRKRKPPLNVFPGEAGHHVEAGLAFETRSVRHPVDQARSQYGRTHQIHKATPPMAQAKAQQHDKRKSRVQEALRAIRGGLEGAVVAAVELYGIPARPCIIGCQESGRLGGRGILNNNG